LNPALPDDDFDVAVRIAQAEFDRHKPDVVVGSSRGGAVAMNIDAGSTPLVLLCPVWKHYGTARTVKPGTAPISVIVLLLLRQFQFNVGSLDRDLGGEKSGIRVAHGKVLTPLVE
jgi:hypothetical protein